MQINISNYTNLKKYTLKLKDSISMRDIIADNLINAKIIFCEKEKINLLINRSKVQEVI